MAKKSGNVKCPKCDRTFKLALHLGRHMAAMHGAKRVKPAVSKRAAKVGRYKPGSAKCSICGRGFGMVAHLARHMNTMHGARPARALPRSGSGDGPAGQVLDQARGWQQALMAQQAQVASQLAAVEQLILTLHG